MKHISFRIFSVLVLLIFSSNFSSAQKLILGPEIGTNLIMMERTDLGRNYHLGWFVGGNVEYELTDYFSLRSGLYFSQRKKMFESADTAQLEVLGFDMSSLGIEGIDFNIYSKTKGVVSQFGIEIPLLAAFNYKGISIFGGPYMHFMTGTWSKAITESRIPFLQTFDIDSLDPTGFLKYLFPPAESSTFNETSSKENLRGFDYGFKTGISYTSENFRVNLYYVLGIPDYRIDRGVNDVNAHHYYSMSINYNFGIGKPGGRSSFGD